MNPGERLLHIYESLYGQQEDRNMVQTWGVVFGIESADPHHDDHVAVCVMALRAELILARGKLDVLGVPRELTSPGFERLRDLAAPGQFNTNWSQHKGTIHPPENKKVFQWVAWALRDDAEADMPAEEMKALLVELDSLESALQSSELSPYLRDFIKRQVDTIRAALRVYGVQGAKPLKEALTKVVGAYTMEGARVEAEHKQAPEEAKGLLKKATEIVQKTAEVCDNLSKVGEFGKKAYEVGTTYGPALLPFLKKLAEGGGA